MHSRRILPTLLVMALIAAACGGAEQVDSATLPTEQSSTESTTTSDSLAAPSAAASATTSSTATTSPSATTSVRTTELVPLVGGGQIDLNSIQGQDTVLWFWAPW